MDLRNLDSTSKFLLVSFSILVMYAAIVSTMALIFSRTTPGTLMLNFGSSDGRLFNMIALALAFGFGFLTSYKLHIAQDEARATRHNLSAGLFESMLNEDEKRVIADIRQEKEITQDSLRFRMEWSKAKVSAVITQLERMGMVQRERTGKTYNVRLSPNASTVYTPERQKGNGSERSGSQHNSIQQSLQNVEPNGSGGQT